MSQPTFQQIISSLVALNSSLVNSTVTNANALSSVNSTISSLSSHVSDVETRITEINGINDISGVFAKIDSISSFVSGKMNEFDNESFIQLSSVVDSEISGVESSINALQEEIDENSDSISGVQDEIEVIESTIDDIQDQLNTDANSLSTMQLSLDKKCGYEYSNIVKDVTGYVFGYVSGDSIVYENRIPNSGTIYLSEGANGKLLAFAAISAQLKLLNDDTDIRALVEDVNGNIQSISDLTNTISGIQTALDSLESITTQNIENSSGYVNENINQSSSTNVELEKYVLTGVAPSITIDCKNGQFIDIDASRSVYAKVMLSSNNNPYSLNLRIVDGDGTLYLLNNKNLISYSDLSAGTEYVYRITSFGNKQSYVENISKNLLYDSVILIDNDKIITTLYDNVESSYISSLNLSSEFNYYDEEYIFDIVDDNMMESSNALSWSIASSSIDNIDDMMYISGNELIFNNPSGLPSTEFTVFFEAAISGKEFVLPSYGELTFKLSSSQEFFQF